MRLEAERLGFGYPGKPVGREVDLSTRRRARLSACSAPTAPARPRCSSTLLGLLPAQAGLRADRRPPARRAAARRGRAPDRLRAAGPCRALPLRRARHGADGPHRASRALRPARAARPRRPRARRSETLGIAALADADYTADQRRPAPARADRARPRPGGALDRHGRADREPRLRQPGPRAARGPGAPRRRATASCSRPTTPTTPSPARARSRCCTTAASRRTGGRRRCSPRQRLEAVYGVPVFVERLASGHTVCAPDLGARPPSALMDPKESQGQRMSTHAGVPGADVCLRLSLRIRARGMWRAGSDHPGLGRTAERRRGRPTRSDRPASGVALAAALRRSRGRWAAARCRPASPAKRRWAIGPCSGS